MSNALEAEPEANEIERGMRCALDLLRCASGVIIGGDVHKVTLEGLKWLNVSLLKVGRKNHGGPPPCFSHVLTNSLTRRGKKRKSMSMIASASSWMQESRFPENIGLYASDMIKELIFSLLKVGDLLNLETLWPSSMRRSKKSLLEVKIIQSRQIYAALIKVLSRVSSSFNSTASTPGHWWENDPEFSNVLNSMGVIVSWTCLSLGSLFFFKKKRMWKGESGAFHACNGV